MRSKKTEQIVFGGLFVAIVFVATYFIQIPTTGISGGLIHLGNIAMFSIALKYGRKYGALSGGLGMMLFDLFSAWFVWAPATLVVRGVMGYVIGLVAQKLFVQRMVLMGNSLPSPHNLRSASLTPKFSSSRFWKLFMAWAVHGFAGICF